MIDIKKLARKNISDIRPYLPGKPIEEVKRELKVKEVYKLASNENPLGPSPLAINGIKKALFSINRYPDSICFYLKKKLAKHLSLKPKNLIIGNGSDEIIILTLKAFLNSGEEVLVSKPTFLIYELAAKIAGARVKIIPMKNFRYNLKEMAKKTTKKTKIIFIANPDNPCGTYVTEKEVEDFMSRVPENIIVYFDEAYYEFVSERDFPNTLKYINKRPIIITRTFSKAYGLAGLRIGYGISHPEIINYLDKVREPFNVNLLAQTAAIHALDDENFLEKSRKLIKEGKLYLYHEFEKLGIDYIPSATNFILIKLNKETKDICNKLLKRGIIVRYMGAWGLKNCIRVTIGKKEENRKFIKEFKKLI
jgi:histidinol-phosphate aminotransferase